MAAHPVDVALQGVDLTIMGQHAEWLGQRPLREGVGGIALVVNRKRTFKALIHQVGIENRHLLGQHHAFVDDRPTRQRTDIKIATCGFLNPATDDVELTLKLFLGHVLFTADQDLLNLWPCRVRLLTKTLILNRHMAPAVDVVPHAKHFGLHNCAALLLRAKVGAWQKDLTDRDQLVVVRLMPCAAHLVVKERHRNLNVDTSAIPCFAIGINCATVPNGLERVDPILNHGAGRRAINGHH